MKALTMIMVALFAAAVCQATGLTRAVSINESIMSKSLSMDNCLSKKLDVSSDEAGLRGNIYEFHSKSPAKAFLFSLLVPGAGQFYNGSKIKAGAFLAIDAAFWSGFLVYHQKGANTEKDYKAYVDQHYLTSQFFNWWNGLDTSVTNKFSHRIYPGVKNREYYENVGKYDQFQVGWDDIGLNHPPPGTPGGDSTGTESPHRHTYLEMRKKSNDYFSNAKTMVIISIGNHIVSAFEAAIGARRYNQGGKQYSLDLQPRNINGRVVPFMVASAKF